MRIAGASRKALPSGSFVAVWILGLPAPAVAAHILERVVRAPAEDARALVRAGVHRRQIARAARRDAVGHVHVVGRFKGVHHFEHAVAPAGAEVKNALARVRRHVGDGRDVAARKIHDVDIVAHAGAVRGGIVVAEDIQVVALADGSLRDIRHEIVRDAVRMLADSAALRSGIASFLPLAEVKFFCHCRGLYSIHYSTIKHDIYTF